MDPRVLVIDDSPDFRILARHYIAIEWPGAKVEEYDPIKLGRPGSGFDWSRYDVVLLDYMLGRENGLEWLKQFRQDPGCPPVIFLTGAGSEDVAVKAMKAGAADYLRKHDLSKARLTEAIAEAVAPAHPAKPAPQEVDLDFTHPEAPPADSPWPRISGYRFQEHIGEGGMSSVYLVNRLSDGQRMVLKVLHAELTHDHGTLSRFVREHGILSKISSPYVARIYDQGFTDDHVYIAMEYFGGDDLKHYMRLGLKPQQALAVLWQIGRALEVIHEAGVVHRDLKPQNVMFREDGSLALVDFGVSRILTEESQLTRHGQVFGTPLYMSPEHGQGRKTDARSDLYSLGAIFWELHTGRKIYTAESHLSLIYKHIHEPVPRLPPELANYQPLLDRLLAKEPGQRFQTARAMLDFVAQQFGEPPATSMAMLPQVGRAAQ